jgi:hypothetical protein
MRRHSAIAVTLLALLAPAPAAIASGGSQGTREQIAWVRRAAGNFIAAELGGNGAAACAILAAPLRAPQGGRSCQARWNARLATLLRDRSNRAGLHADSRAVGSARVLVHGWTATIALPAPLLAGRSRFVWSENCWMLER